MCSSCPKPGSTTRKGRRFAADCRAWVTRASSASAPESTTDLRIASPEAESARAAAEEMANKLLANPVIQTFVIESVTEATED